MDRPVTQWMLNLGLAGEGGPPVFLQIARAVSDAVRVGRLRPGQRLPGSRRMADALGVHRNTVLAAYAELTAEGWLDSRQGLGLYVAPARQRLSDAERDRRLDDAIQRFLHDVIALDFAPDEVQARLHHEFLALAPRKSA